MPLQSVPVIDVETDLSSANAQHVEVAAKRMADQCQQGGDAVRKGYAEAGAVAALVAAMTTHRAHPGAQQQLFRAIYQQAQLSHANQVRRCP